TRAEYGTRGGGLPERQDLKTILIPFGHDINTLLSFPKPPPAIPLEAVLYLLTKEDTTICRNSQKYKMNIAFYWRICYT
ncbi:MAG: hypothetical protein J6X60_12195, partial [Ruminiclostridium sp.]|nr:hypothetical protein [Ruminiclostridium sp.]